MDVKVGNCLVGCCIVIDVDVEFVGMVGGMEVSVCSIK